MKQSFSLSAFVIVALLSFNSCLGDKGNITISYGTGTILCDTLSNTPYIRLDDIGLCLTGNGVPTLSDSIARAMVNYTVDWDNQSATAQATGIFEASLSNLSTWGINKISSMPSDFSFIKTDTMQGIARPFITYKTPLSPNMLTMNVRLFNSTSSLELIQKNRPADDYYIGQTNDTLIISYTTEEVTTEKRDSWYTFELPDYPSNISRIILIFKGINISGFTPVPNHGEAFGGYTYTLSTTFKNEQQQ